MTEKNLRDSQPARPQGAKQAYEAPKVESVQLTREAAEALT